jgi:hypothetical protein
VGGFSACHNKTIEGEDKVSTATQTDPGLSAALRMMNDIQLTVLADAETATDYDVLINNYTIDRDGITFHGPIIVEMDVTQGFSLKPDGSVEFFVWDNDLEME